MAVHRESRLLASKGSTGLPNEPFHSPNWRCRADMQLAFFSGAQNRSEGGLTTMFTVTVEERRPYPHPPTPPTATATTGIVFVVDDDVSVRESLELLFDTAGWRAETFASASEFLLRPQPNVPSCLVLDVTLPDVSGLELQKQLGNRTEMPIICITAHGDIATSVQAMKAGAIEFLTKPLQTEPLLRAVRDAIARSDGALGQQSRTQTLRSRYASLTPREREVMALVVAGLLNKQVGGELGISEITVKAHRGQVMRKMKAESLPDLVRMTGRLEPPPIRTDTAR
jgi:FixJ family two-component response regulator